MNARRGIIHHKHARVFGVSVNYSEASAAELDRTIRDFVAAPSTVRIDGRWKKQPAIIYTDYDDRVAVICERDGEFVTALDLAARQYWYLWHDHCLGGGW